MTRTAHPLTRGDRLRAVAACMLAASLVACGGGGGGGPGSTPPAPPPPPPPPPVGVQCTDPTPAISSTVMFAAPAASAASSVGVSANGTSACFVGTAARGVKSTVAITPGASSFYYFEAQRSAQDGVAFGVSESAAAAPPTGNAFAPRKDTLVISGAAIQYVDSAGVTQTESAGDGAVFGFAVDYRAAYPIVNVIGPASVNPACAPLTGSAPCVLSRWKLAVPAASLFIYAYGSGDGTAGPRTTINTGSNLAAKPFVYSTPAVMEALRARRVQGDRDFNAQWPAATGPAVQPALVRVGHDRVVIRSGDTTPYRTRIEVTANNTGNGTISWKDGKSEASAVLGTGATLNMSVLSALTAGEHTVTASVVNPTNGRYTDVSFRVLVLAAAFDTDDDGDGLTYDQEKALLTDPGNADTDGDGLSDGAEAGLSKDPLVADNPNPDNLPLRGQMVMEPGVTSRGLILTDDGYSVIFTSELNAECVQHQGIFAADLYYAEPDHTTNFSLQERCRKRAVRANVGVKPGEFRYFETQRPAGPVENVGQGIITATAMIDPYCCFVDQSDTDNYPYFDTPPSLTINSVGGVFRRLNNYGATFGPQPFSLDATEHYGFAVDYRGANPVVYLVVQDESGAMTVSDGIAVDNFGGGPAMPMLHGHPLSETEPRLTMNLGLQKFHYDLAAVRAALTGHGAANVSELTFGVGLHRWP